MSYLGNVLDDGIVTVTPGRYPVVTVNEHGRVTQGGQLQVADLPAGLSGQDNTLDVFLAGTQFTPGSTTALTLSKTGVTAANTMVYFDAAVQLHDQYSINGTTLTFTSAIPSDIERIEVIYGSARSITVATADDAVKLGGVVASDYARKSVVNAFTAKQFFNSTMRVQETLEKVTKLVAVAGAVQTLDVLSGALNYWTTPPAANWTLNIRGNASVSLDSMMGLDESLTVTVLTKFAATAFYPIGLTVDGVAATVLWVGTVPTAGDINAMNVYTYTIIKESAGVFTVLCSKSKAA